MRGIVARLRGPPYTKRMRQIAALPLLAALAGCAATSGTEPSLAPRAAEAIDPRIPLPAESPIGTVDPALASRLDEVLGQGRDGSRLFDAQVGAAEALASAAGPAQSESWIAAQQALSGLEGARAKTTAALAEVDSIASARIQSGVGMSPADLAAVEAASRELGAIAERQNATIDRLGVRLR